MPISLSFDDVMKYREFRAAVRKARWVVGHVVIYSDDDGNGCDGEYFKITKEDILKKTKADKDAFFKAHWGTSEYNKDILFIN